MESNEFKNVCIKNRTFFFFNDMMKLEDFDFDNTLIDERSHEYILIYDISYKTLVGSKTLRIRCDEVDGFNRIYDGTRYLTLFGSEKYDAMYDRIRYLISLKSGIACNFTHYFAKFIVDSYDSLHIEKRWNLHNVILIKSVLNKDKNHNYCKIFL